MTSSYEVVKAWRAVNPEKRAAQSKRYAAKHPETRIKAVAKYRATHVEEIRVRDRVAKQKERIRNPEAERRRQLAFYARKEVRLAIEAGRPRPDKCDLCHAEGKTVFDHCHQHGNFRGWLCDRCNRTLGQVKDDPNLLRKMADYLESNNGQTYLEAAE